MASLVVDNNTLHKFPSVYSNENGSENNEGLFFAQNS